MCWCWCWCGIWACPMASRNDGEFAAADHGGRRCPGRESTRVLCKKTGARHTRQKGSPGSDTNSRGHLYFRYLGVSAPVHVAPKIFGADKHFLKFRRYALLHMLSTLESAPCNTLPNSLAKQRSANCSTSVTERWKRWSRHASSHRHCASANAWHGLRKQSFDG